MIDEAGRGPDGYFHPSGEDEIIDLVQYARDAGHKLRVRGSGHSVPGAILATPEKSNVDLMLDKFRAMHVGKNGYAKVKAGCNLGFAPYYPGSTLDNSLLSATNAAGWTLPDLGGITHQTVGGFISTGSSGGSLTYSFEDAINSISLVDGNGEKHLFTRDRNPEAFNAAGVSMGLFGVITEVSFKLTESFCIRGQEAVTTTADCEIDLFGEGSASKPSLADFLRNQNSRNPAQALGAEYSRIMWWPQPHADKVAVWKASRMPCPAGFSPQPYQELLGGGVKFEDLGDDAPILLGKVVVSVWSHRKEIKALLETLSHRITANDVQAKILEDLAAAEQIGELDELFKQLLEQGLEIVVGAIFSLVGNRHQPGLAHDMFKEIFESEAAFESRWYPFILNKLFVVADKDKAEPDTGKPQSFQDYGWTGLPMDNQIDDQLMPTVFTELWIPIEHTRAVMNDLREFYAQGLESTGTYACEIYGAKASDFYMSPAYHTDVVRIDIFWFARNAQSPAEDFFPKFWELLHKYDFRFHWGKYLSSPDSASGAAYRRQHYPYWDRFMALREKLDPQQIFVSDYWQKNLGIAPL